MGTEREWTIALFDKFPTFDPSWDQAVQNKWLETFSRLKASVEASRTPDLTEALARLKALGEEVADSYEDQGKDCGCTPMKWADEIAAIRKALGASDAEPKPEP